MAAIDIVYNQFMLNLSEKLIDLDADLFRVRLCMTNSVAGGDSDTAINDTIRRAANLTVLGNIDGTGDPDGIDVYNGEVDGATYDSADDDQVIGSPSANLSSAAGVNRMNFSGNNVEWTTVGGTGANGTRDIQGALVYWQPGSGASETTRIPVCYIVFASPIETDGSDITIKWDGGASSGNILRMAQAAAS